jgi:hypothetical protein
LKQQRTLAAKNVKQENTVINQQQQTVNFVEKEGMVLRLHKHLNLVVQVVVKESTVTKTGERQNQTAKCVVKASTTSRQDKVEKPIVCLVGQENILTSSLPLLAKTALLENGPVVQNYSWAVAALRAVKENGQRFQEDQQIVRSATKVRTTIEMGRRNVKNVQSANTTWSCSQQKNTPA